MNSPFQIYTKRTPDVEAALVTTTNILELAFLLNAGGVEIMAENVDVVVKERSWVIYDGEYTFVDDEYFKNFYKPFSQ